MAHSTTSKKPEKPYEDFPLFPHATNRWAKKIKGRLHYFGPWNDWQGALERYQYQVHYLQQGKTPPPQNVSALTVDGLVNGFLEHREAKLNAGDLSKLTFDDYKRLGAKLIASLGRYTAVADLQPSDFRKLREEFASRGGLVNLVSNIRRTKAFFNYGAKNFNVRAHMGMEFDPPSRKAIKREAESKPKRIFTLDELQTLYHAADIQMRAFMLLALNGGMGNNDIGLLEHRHIKNGWVNFPRPKTLVERSFPLWRETIKAIEAAKQTESELPFVFRTKYGNCWSKAIADNPISKEFRKLCIDCKLHQKGRGFYSLRHQFRTVADGCRDRVAIDHVMGHADDSMGGNYREWVDPKRLQAVVDHVYKWINPMFRKPAKRKGGAK